MNWNIFFDYLERKSKEYLTRIEKNGRMIKEQKTLIEIVRML